MIRILTGDCREVLASLPSESVHCVVTSPPYYGLRDYGTVGQLGLEATPAEFIANMVAVFREVRRVLRKDGTLWLNISDSRDSKRREWQGIPHKLVFALQQDGWRWEDEIVWSKKNCMPESVTTRTTRSHEYIFVLARTKAIYYDADAIREESQDLHAAKAGRLDCWSSDKGMRSEWMQKRSSINNNNGLGKRSVDLRHDRNKRSVWEIATEPSPGSHFAVFPTALVEPCIKAGTSEKGCCPKCGAPWMRVVERAVNGTRYETPGDRLGWAARRATIDGGPIEASGLHSQYLDIQRSTIAWRSSCEHTDLTPIPAAVLDPFCGAGTTLLVADRLGRDAIGVELNATYAEMARLRCINDAPMFVVSL